MTVSLVERAASTTAAVGRARQWWASINCVRLYLARHPPIALGGLCMSCAKAVGAGARAYVRAEGGARGVVHADCADRFSLNRTAHAMAALERLEVGDPKV